MAKWLNQGEVLRWYGKRPQSTKEIEKKYRPKTHSDSKTKGYIIENRGSPIGYLQCYRISDHPSYYAQISASPGDYGIDLFIGADSRIGRGLGKSIVKAALESLVFAHEDASRCIIAPSPENARAIKCYENCGFEYVRTVEFPSGEQEYVMALESTDQTTTYPSRCPLDNKYEGKHAQQ